MLPQAFLMRLDQFLAVLLSLLHNTLIPCFLGLWTCTAWLQLLLSSSLSLSL